MEKKCFKCGIIQPLESFYKNIRMADGYLGKCKDCAKKDVSENYKANIKYYIEYEKKRFNTKKRKEYVIRYQKEQRKSNPLISKARNKISRAKRSKKIIPCPCYVCGHIGNNNAHHPNNNDLSIISWLCWHCHMAIHGKLSHI